MFISMQRLKAAVREAFNDADADVAEIKRLKNEVADLQLKKRIEEAEIRHLTKMKSEKDALELDRKVVEMERKFQTKEAELRETYHGKVLALLQESKNDAQKIHQEILKRLPDVNVTLNKTI